MQFILGSHARKDFGAVDDCLQQARIVDPQTLECWSVKDEAVAAGMDIKQHFFLKTPRNNL